MLMVEIALLQFDQDNNGQCRRAERREERRGETLSREKYERGGTYVKGRGGGTLLGRYRSSAKHRPARYMIGSTSLDMNHDYL